jgi:hypothetical protein
VRTHARNSLEVAGSRSDGLQRGSTGYALFFMFQNGITSGIAMMSDKLSR